MDSDTSLSLPTTTAATDYTDPACPPTATSHLPFRGVFSSPPNSLNQPDSLPWDNDYHHHQNPSQTNHQQQQQQQPQQRSAKRLCTGLFKNFPGCKTRSGSTSDEGSISSSSVSDAGRYVSQPDDTTTTTTTSSPITNHQRHPRKQPAYISNSYRSVEEFHQRSLDHFPSPSLLFPQPALEFDFRIAVKLRPEPSRLDPRPMPSDTTKKQQQQQQQPFSSSSSSSATQPAADAKAPNAASSPQPREIIAVQSGSWSGSFGHGKVLAGGYDLGQARGFRPIRIVEGVFVMQTTDDTPAILEMRTRGSLSGPCDVLDNLLSPLSTPKTTDPRRYGFRMFSTIKTTDKRYAEIVNCGLWVASGVWRNDELIIE
ncbi:UPF0311 protein [Sarocladium implicatum]|nr:UPF0311 protein [Sarocladium implicatum]